MSLRWWDHIPQSLPCPFAIEDGLLCPQGMVLEVGPYIAEPIDPLDPRLGQWPEWSTVPKLTYRCQDCDRTIRLNEL